MVIRLHREEAGDEPSFIAVALGNIARAHGNPGSSLSFPPVPVSIKTNL
jgi:hypothetical protein